MEIEDKAAGKTVTIYTAGGGAVEVPETVLGLLPADTMVGTSAGGSTDVAIAVDSGNTVTLPTLTKDVKYVSALKLWDTAAGSEKIFYANGEATGYTEITPAANTYVQAKAPLMVRVAGEPGATTGITINGVDYTATVDEGGFAEIPVTDLVGYAEGESNLTVAPYAAKIPVTVKVDGAVVATDAKSGDVITLTTPVTGTLITGKQCASNGATQVKALAGSGYKKIQLTDALVAAKDADGVLELNTAYTVEAVSQASGDWTLADTREADAITLADNDLIAKDYELTLTAKNAATTAKVEEGSKYTLGAPTWSEDGKAVYTIKVTADIADDEFATGIAVTTRGLNNAGLAAIENGSTSVEIASNETADGTVEVIVAGLTAETPITAKWSYKGDESALKSLAIKSKIESGKVVFTFVNETSEKVTLVKDSNDSTANADMLVNIGGVEVTVTVVVAVAST